MTAATAEAAPQTVPSLWPLAEETLTSNPDWAAIWTDPIDLPALPRYCDGEPWQACVTVTRRECEDIVDEACASYLVSRRTRTRWARERAAGDMRRHGPLSGFPDDSQPLPRFIPADDTATDLPVITDAPEPDTEAMTKFLALHDGQDKERPDPYPHYDRGDGTGDDR